MISEEQIQRMIKSNEAMTLRIVELTTEVQKLKCRIDTLEIATGNF